VSRKLPTEARVLATLLANPGATDTEIARLANVSRTHLYRMPKYRAARAAARTRLPRGVRHDDGDVEAWSDDRE